MSSAGEPPLNPEPLPDSTLGRKLFWVLPIAALVLTGVTVWKLNQPRQKAPLNYPDPKVIRAAPLFELRDPQNSLVRLSTYLGREKIVVIFFQARRHFDDSPVLVELNRGFDKLYPHRPKILAIGTEQAGIYRRWLENDGPEPFFILSDLLEPHVYERWGAVEPKTNQPIEAVFLVDRAGWIQASHLGPDHLGTAEEWAKELAKIR